MSLHEEGEATFFLTSGRLESGSRSLRDWTSRPILRRVSNSRPELAHGRPQTNRPNKQTNQVESNGSELN